VRHARQLFLQGADIPGGERARFSAVTGLVLIRKGIAGRRFQCQHPFHVHFA